MTGLNIYLCTVCHFHRNRRLQSLPVLRSEYALGAENPFAEYLFFLYCYIPRNGSIGTVEVVFVLLYQSVIYTFCCVPLFAPGFLILDKPGIDILLVWVKLGKCSFLLYLWQRFILIAFVNVLPYRLTVMASFSGNFTNIFPFLKVHFSDILNLGHRYLLVLNSVSQIQGYYFGLVPSMTFL
jgi:hypothetical protein